MNPWPLVFADLRTNRAGAVTIVLLVALAVALGVAVSAQERALRQGSARAAEPFDLIVGAPGSETQLVLSTVYLQAAAIDLLPGSVLAELARDPAAAMASPVGFGDNYRGHPVVGVAPAFVARLAGQKRLAEGAVFARIDEAVVGAAVPAKLGDRLVPAHGQVETEDEEHHEGFAYRVVGRLPRLGSPWDGAVVVPIEAVWWIHALPLGHREVEGDGAHDAPETAGPRESDEREAGHGHGPPGVAEASGAPHRHPPAGEALPDIPVGPPWTADELPGVPAIVVRPASFAAAYALRQRYRERPDATAVFPAEVLVQLYGLLGDVRDLVAVISVLTQVLVVGAVLLAVLASLAQRRRLIGVLRALGASRGFVFATVWSGVALMLAAAGTLGLGLGYLCALLLSHLFAAETGVALPVALSGQEFGLVLAIVVAGLLLATVPAALAYRGSVAAALRA